MCIKGCIQGVMGHTNRLASDELLTVVIEGEATLSNCAHCNVSPDGLHEPLPPAYHLSLMRTVTTLYVYLTYLPLMRTVTTLYVYLTYLPLVRTVLVTKLYVYLTSNEDTVNTICLPDLLTCISNEDTDYTICLPDLLISSEDND